MVENKSNGTWPVATVYLSVMYLNRGRVVSMLSNGRRRLGMMCHCTHCCSVLSSCKPASPRAAKNCSLGTVRCSGLLTELMAAPMEPKPSTHCTYTHTARPSNGVSGGEGPKWVDTAASAPYLGCYTLLQAPCEGGRLRRAEWQLATVALCKGSHLDLASLGGVHHLAQPLVECLIVDETCVSGIIAES